MGEYLNYNDVLSAIESRGYSNQVYQYFLKKGVHIIFSCMRSDHIVWHNEKDMLKHRPAPHWENYTSIVRPRKRSPPQKPKETA